MQKATMMPGAGTLYLKPVLGSRTPTWAGAVWIGATDRQSICGADKIILEDAEGFLSARILVRNGEAVAFCSLPLTDTDITAVLKSLTSKLPPTQTEMLSPHTDSCALASVIVCTRERPELLHRALESIAALDDSAFEVVVVDNAPRTKATVAVLEAVADPRFKYVLEKRPGLSRARNTGCRAAQGELLCFTDDDVIVDSQWLSAIRRGAARSKRVGCVTGLVPTAKLVTAAQGYFDNMVKWSRRGTPALYSPESRPAHIPFFPFQAGHFGTGANFAITRSALSQIGPFDEALGSGAITRGGEDLDYFFRTIASGWDLAYEPSAIVWHEHRDNIDDLAEQFYGYRSGLSAWLTKIALRPRWLLLAIRVLLRGLPQFLAAYKDARNESRKTAVHWLALSKQLSRTGFRGLCAGPVLYLRARWSVRWKS